MKEEDLTKIIDELINPLRDEHIAFMEKIFETLQKVFEKGVGFLKAKDRSSLLFFHISGLEKGLVFEDLKVGDVVYFKGIDITQKGEMAVGIINNK